MSSSVSIQRRVYTLVAPIVAYLLFSVLQYSGFLQPFENILVNRRIDMREAIVSHRGAIRDFLEGLGLESLLPPSLLEDPVREIVLVGIDDYSLEHIGGWPWDRAVHGDMIQLLAASKPAAVAFDILFTEPRSKESDKYLADAARDFPNLITGAKRAEEGVGEPAAGKTLTQPFTSIEGDISNIFGSDQALFPIQPLRARSQFGFVDSDPSSGDGIRRYQPLMMRVGQTVYPSLTLQALLFHLGAGSGDVHVALGEYLVLRGRDQLTRMIPIDKHGRMLINYRADDRYAQHFSYAKLMHQLGRTHIQGEKWPEEYPALEGKIVFVGQTAVGLSDFGPSPLSSNAPLVLTHVNAIGNILNHEFLTMLEPFDDYTPGQWPRHHTWLLGVWFVLAWGTLLALSQSGVLVSLAVPGVLAALYGLGAHVVFFTGSVLVPLAWPLIGFVVVHAGAGVLRWVEDRQSRQNIREIFATYVSPSVLEKLLSDPENIQLGGARKAVTIFFSDIRDFTAISEGGDEQTLVAQLNEYFEKMVDCITVRNGTLHKYIGDAIMALWGDIISTSAELDASQAVAAAVEMRKALSGLNEGWKRRGIRPVKIGMGLNHGVVCVGNIGAPQRKEFTAIGDAVNLASRLEGVTKQFGTDLIISDSVLSLIGDAAYCRTIGQLVVKGKSQPVGTYEVLGLKGDENLRFSPEWLQVYEASYQCFCGQDFEQASNGFAQCQNLEPGDKATELYLRLCNEYLMEPPELHWRGEIKLDSK